MHDAFANIICYHGKQVIPGVVYISIVYIYIYIYIYISHFEPELKHLGTDHLSSL